MYLVIENTERSMALLPVYAKTVGTDYVQYPTYRPHGAPFHHIFFVEKGTARFTTDQGSVTLGEGTALFMQKGYAIRYEGLDATLRTGWVTFDGAGVCDLLAYFDAAPFSHQKDAPLRELYRSCIISAERSSSPAVLSRLCYDLIVTYFLSLREGSKSSGLIAAKEYITKNYRADLAVADVARAAGISESLLYRLFREEGSTPVEYLRTVRLGHAKRLLLEFPKMSVAEIATACGFADSAYFCKVFRDREHITPKGYRGVYIP